MADKKKFVPVVAVLNMKGGVGKTTISAHVFRELFEQKKTGTLLLDLDPQFNLTQTLFKRPAYDKLKSIGKTILSVMEPPSDLGLFEVKTSSEPPPKARDVGSTLYHFGGAKPPIELTIIPGDFKLARYSLMDDNKQLGYVRDRFKKFIDESKNDYSLIVIDCNPSSSFLTLCALQNCTHVLVPVRGDKYSILGLELLFEFVENLPSISPKPQFIIAINGTPRRPNKEAVAIETELRGHPTFGARTLASVIKESGHLKAKTDYTGFATDKRGSWTGILRTEIRAFADELSKKLGI